MPVESRAPNRKAKMTTCRRPRPANPALLMPMLKAPVSASSHCASESGASAGTLSYRHGDAGDREPEIECYRPLSGSLWDDVLSKRT